MKYSIYFVAVVLIVVGAGVYVTRTGPAAEERSITIGVVMPLSGSLAKFGEWTQNALEIAKDELNQSGGINGKQIELIYEDTKCIPRDTISALNKLLIDGMSSYIGPMCGSSMIVAGEFSKKNKLVGITPNIGMGKLSAYSFNTLSPLTDEPKHMAKFAYEELGFRNIAIYFFNNDFGVQHRDAFAEAFETLGGIITRVESIRGFDQSDFRSELTKIKSDNPDAIYFAYSAIGSVINQARELGYEGAILSQYGIENPDVLSVAGKNAEGVIYTYRGVRPNERTEPNKSFLAKYEERYGEHPGLESYEAYDALNLLANAIRECSDEHGGECIADVLAHTTNYDGASGVFSINPESYEVEKPTYIKTIRDGEFVIYEE